MKILKYKKMDAFASLTSSGNPAGVIYIDKYEDLNNYEMQTIAKEQKGFVSEVGFIWQENNDNFGLRYYSSEREVDFCGHATIAVMYDLIKSTPELLAKNEVTIKTKNDILHVENHILKNDAVFITAPNPRFIKQDINKKDLSDALKMEIGDINDNLDIAIINSGLQALIVPVKSLKIILQITPTLQELNKFCKSIKVDTIILFTNDCHDKSNSYRTRVFAPTFGYLEDPATGSANSAFGHYLLQRDMWKGNLINIEQNDKRKNFNVVKLISKDNKVLFGGSANVKIAGEYFLQ